jgi:hypothetical protein
MGHVFRSESMNSTIIMQLVYAPNKWPHNNEIDGEEICRHFISNGLQL